MIVVKRQDALHQVPHPRLPIRDPESSEAVTCALLAAHSTIHNGRPATHSSRHQRPETRSPESEYRRDARRVEHLQTSMGCVRVRIRSRPRRLVITTLPMRRRRTGRYPGQNGTIHSEQTYFRCHRGHAIDSRHRSSHRCAASRACSHAAIA